MSRESRAGALAFLAASATLFAQVAVHRIVSAKMLNNFAFFVLSLTMLGFAASGAWLSRHPERWRDPLGEVIGVGAAVFGLGLVAATAVLYPAPAVEDWGGSTRIGFLVAFLSCVPLGLLYAVAFAGSGLVLGTLLSSPALPTRRLYGLDLVGSALGAFAVIPAVTRARRRAGGGRGGRRAARGRLPPGPSPWPPWPGPRGPDRARAGRRARRAVHGLPDAVCPRLVPRPRPGRGRGLRARARGLGPDRAHRGLARARSRSRDERLALALRHRPGAPVALPPRGDPEQQRLHLRPRVRRRPGHAPRAGRDGLRGRLPGQPRPEAAGPGRGGGRGHGRAHRPAVRRRVGHRGRGQRGDPRDPAPHLPRALPAVGGGPPGPARPRRGPALPGQPRATSTTSSSCPVSTR